jgi:glycosyltransferase involved in cell wall biosynthesis
MPVYNGERYLKSSIEAVLSQTMTDFEVIIADNASDDGTEDICQGLAKLDRRIRYVRNSENLGAALNYNKVFDLACGKYFRWNNADDLIEKSLHERCAEVLDNNKDAVLSYGKSIIIDDLDNQLEPYDDNLDLQQPRASDRFIQFFNRVRMVNVLFGLMRADAMRKTNLFGDGSLPVADYKFLSELALQGTFVEIPDVLFYRRMHPDASSWDRQDIQRQQQFWKGRTEEFKLPETRLHVSYLNSIHRLETSSSEKFRLTLYIAKRLYFRKKKIAKELYDYFRHFFVRKRRVNK